MHLPDKKHAYIIIEKENGIKDLCYVNMGKSSLKDAMDKLGRPDHYYQVDAGRLIPGEHVYQFYDYGLSLGAMDGKIFSIIIRPKSLKPEANAIEHIRFYDDKKLTYPVTIEKIFELYGQPEKEVAYVPGLGLKYECKSSIGFSGNLVQVVYYFDNSYFRFHFKKDVLDYLDIRAIGW